jgi:fatty acid desaturase
MILPSVKPLPSLCTPASHKPLRTAGMQPEGPALKGAGGSGVLNTDVGAATRCEYLFAPPASLRALLLPLLDNPKDEALLWALLNVALLVPPAACFFVLCAPRCHLAGAAYLVALDSVFLQRFMLSLHFSQHRRLFRKGLGALNALPALLCPLFGLPPGVYRLHHCAMHHSEGNSWSGDVSSTEGYQRDKPAHCALYVLRFLLFTALELPLYAVRTGRYAQAVGVAAGVSGYACAAAWVGTHVGTAAALWLFAVPFVVTQCALAFGNWSQHVFINPEAPRHAYSMAYTCINHGDNQRTFNDGYHATHHAYSRLHWSELPAVFMDQVAAHGEKDALVFSGVHFFDIGIAVLTGRLGWLADRVVTLPGQQTRSKHQVVAELRRRLRPVLLAT